MASEDARVPFAYSHSQSPVRLLELPPALLSLISTDPAPILKIKAPSPPSGTTPSSSTNNAVLCTTSETYFLRHVHSSNSVFLLKPTTTGGVAAVSTASSYLELLPTSPDSVLLLEKHLRPYHGWEDVDDDFGKHSIADDDGATLSRINLQNDLPISDAEFDAAWRECIAFELNGIPSKPVPSVVLKTLSTVSTATTAEGFSLTKNFTLSELVKAVDEADIPPLLIHAVMARVCDQQDGSDGWVLNSERCCLFVGKTVLQDWAEQQRGLKAKNDLLYISFMNKWKSATPDACTMLCQLELLKGWYTLPSPNTIRYVPTGDAQETQVNPDSPAEAPPKNKWHEKFGKGKGKRR